MGNVRRLQMLGSGIYIDTDHPDYVLEFSLDKRYVKVIPMNNDDDESSWYALDSSTIRHGVGYDAMHYRKQRRYPVMLKFPILENLARLLK